ncbi:MAG: hypothetical protein COA78_15905 [Blastopirellula sp.]|nr:MAG: hypothetical protein COA78_15905 [Blastopirellula sp.]
MEWQLFQEKITLRHWGQIFIALTMVFGGLQGIWIFLPPSPKVMFALPGLFMLFYLLNVFTGVLITGRVFWKWNISA